MTITEGLAEIRTIAKRLRAKREFVLDYLHRQERFKDPLESDGGSEKAISEARQSIADLEQRIIDIRTAIDKANRATTLTLHGTERTIAEWLVWRREVYHSQVTFLRTMMNHIREVRRKAAEAEVNIVQGDAKASDNTDVRIYVNEKELSEDIERIEQMWGDLDGQLTLLNSTTEIDL